MSVQNTFASIFDKIATEIKYDESWANGTGYFDRGVQGIALEEGARTKFTDDSGRRAICVGTALGTCVFFERYSPKADGARCEIIVSNVPKQLVAVVGNGAMDEDVLFQNAGFENQNVGTAVKWIVESVNKKAA